MTMNHDPQENVTLALGVGLVPAKSADYQHMSGRASANQRYKVLSAQNPGRPPSLLLFFKNLLAVLENVLSRLACLRDLYPGCFYCIYSGHNRMAAHTQQSHIYLLACGNLHHAWPTRHGVNFSASQVLTISASDDIFPRRPALTRPCGFFAPFEQPEACA